MGDSFWIREQEVPDYWWDGTQALEQEGPKVDLSPYYMKDEINNIVNDINQKIEDKSTSIIFDTYIQMKSFVDDPTNADKLKEGTILLIRQKNVPDYYYDGAGIVKMEADVEQCLYVTLANKPTESTISYTQDREVTNFAPGAIARWVDADGNNVFYKLVEIVGGKAKWITLIDTRYGNVTLQSTYDKNYEIVNIVSGSRLQAINSDKDEIKFVNSATGNVTVVFNATVSGGAKKLTSLLAVNEVVLTPGAAASFTRTGENFTLSDLFGVTIFPDLADANPDDKRPSGVLQAPSGFIKGQSNGSPSTPMEMVYVLMNNYGWRFSMAPEASVLRSIRSSDIDTRLYKPYKLIVFDDGRTFVGNGDVLAHDTDKVLSFGGQPEGEYLCDSMGLDRNVIVEYFNKIGNG